MVLPAENPLFSAVSGQEFQAGMIDYIRTNFADILGDDLALLDQPNGLELLQEIVKERLSRSGLKTGRRQVAA